MLLNTGWYLKTLEKIMPNSLKRELFTTAWRLADEYDFDDEWRITEKQIKQYNEIQGQPFAVERIVNYASK